MAVEEVTMSRCVLIRDGEVVRPANRLLTQSSFAVIEWCDGGFPCVSFSFFWAKKREKKKKTRPGPCRSSVARPAPPLPIHHALRAPPADRRRHLAHWHRWTNCQVSLSPIPTYWKNTPDRCRRCKEPRTVKRTPVCIGIQPSTGGSRSRDRERERERKRARTGVPVSFLFSVDDGFVLPVDE